MCIDDRRAHRALAHTNDLFFRKNQAKRPIGAAIGDAGVMRWRSVPARSGRVRHWPGAAPGMTLMRRPGPQRVQRKSAAEAHLHSVGHVCSLMSAQLHGAARCDCTPVTDCACNCATCGGVSRCFERLCHGWITVCQGSRSSPGLQVPQKDCTPSEPTRVPCRRLKLTALLTAVLRQPYAQVG